MRIVPEGHGRRSGRKSAAQPSLSGAQSARRRRDSNTPPMEIARYRCFASRGSTRIECRNSPSGVREPRRPLRTHRVVVEARDRLPVLTAVLRAEQSCGALPAYHVPCSDGMTGREPEHPLDGAAADSALDYFAKGRRLRASRQVLPRSLERNTVGPKCPVLAAISSVLRIARILHDMVDDVAQKLRPRDAPVLRRTSRAQRESAFAGADPEGGGHGGAASPRAPRNCQPRGRPRHSVARRQRHGSASKKIIGGRRITRHYSQ